jgi:predicted Rossmann-fold nucleotide-binding protein
MKSQDNATDDLPWHIVFVASTTPEKLRDFQQIAKEKRWPIMFADIREIIGVYHNVDEDGKDFKVNAGLKRQVIERFVDKLRKDSGKLEGWCKDNGLVFDRSRVHFITEDSGFSVPREIWDKIDKDGIPPHILERIDKASSRTMGGPAVETGPVVSATLGSKNLMERILQAAGPDVQRAHIEATQYSTVAVLSLDAPNHTFKPLTVEVPSYIRPNYDQGPRISNYTYVRSRDRPYSSAAALGHEFITKFSPRSNIVDFLAEEVCKLKPVHKIKEMPKRSPSKEFHVGVLGAGDFKLDDLRRLFNDVGARDKVTPAQMTTFDEKHHEIEVGAPAARAQAALTYIENLMEQSDAVLLPPVDRAADDQAFERAQRMYDLMSLIVAKQLHPRDSNKPVIVMNHQGAWDDAVALHYDLANMSLTKEHTILLPTDVNGTNGSVKAHSNSYFHVLSGDDLHKIEKAASHLLSQARQGFVSIKTGTQPTMSDGQAPGSDKRFKVAVFCSASCENDTLNKTLQNMTYKLSKDGYGIVYGGGDRYTMGAVLGGVKKHRSELVAQGMTPEVAKEATYIAGISTDLIAASETEKGELSSDLNYRELTADIYDRMAKMLAPSDAIVIAPGGAGTVQEWMAALMLRKLEPQAFADKPIVVFNPQLLKEKSGLDEHSKKVWDQMLAYVLGKEDYALLTSTDEGHQAARLRCSHELGMYVENSAEAVEKRLGAIAREKTRPAAAAGRAAG